MADTKAFWVEFSRFSTKKLGLRLRTLSSLYLLLTFYFNPSLHFTPGLQSAVCVLHYSTGKILKSLEFSNVRLWSKAPDWRSVKDVYWKLTYWEIFSTHRSQIPHSETNPHTAHHRADMHQSEPTQKYSLRTHVQGLQKVLHWKHNTILTRSRERAFDQRQLVR